MRTLAKGVVFRRANNSIEILLLKRTEAEGGFWQPVGGSVEDGESIEDALFRELSEEADVNIADILSIIPDLYRHTITKHHTSGKDRDPIEEFVFGVEVKSDSSISIDKNHCNEHEDFGWFLAEDALKKVKWDNDVVSIKNLLKLLK